MTTLRFLVSGAVQGVGFRYFVVRQGAILGLHGWTRNLPDGRVEVVARGSDELLERLQEALAAGPPHARVNRLDVSEISDETISSKAFEIR